MRQLQEKLRRQNFVVSFDEKIQIGHELKRAEEIDPIIKIRKHLKKVEDSHNRNFPKESIFDDVNKLLEIERLK